MKTTITVNRSDLCVIDDALYVLQMQLEENWDDIGDQGPIENDPTYAALLRVIEKSSRAKIRTYKNEFKKRD